VLDPEINLSDHLPAAIRCNCLCSNSTSASDLPYKPKVKQLRCDHADLLSYYSTTIDGELLAFEKCCSMVSSDVYQVFIDGFYSKLVETLKYSADIHVQHNKKTVTNYYY